MSEELENNLNPDRPVFGAMPDALKRMLGIGGNKADEKVLATMTPAEMASWMELQDARETMQAAETRHTALKERFWAQVILDHKIRNYTNIRINEKTQQIMIIYPKEDA
jgi:hypothetical protein